MNPFAGLIPMFGGLLVLIGLAVYVLIRSIRPPRYRAKFRMEYREPERMDALPYTFSGFELPDGQPIAGDFDPDASEPIEVRTGMWVFRRKCFRVEDAENVPSGEIALRVKHAAYRMERKLEKIQKEVAGFENFERLPSSRRERIPESVRLFVWQRDSGRCVKCESNERLEFDHIIPVVEGGSSTERNVQLLCEKCNREKGKTI